MLELILVMIVLAIGTAIAVPNLQASKWKRQMGVATKSLQTVADSIRLYHMDYEPVETTWPILAPPVSGILNELQGKGYLKIEELFPVVSCYRFDYDPIGSSVYKMKIFPMVNNVCNLSEPKYFWLSMDLTLGRKADKKGIGTTLTLDRVNNPNDF